MSVAYLLHLPEVFELLRIHADHIVLDGGIGGGWQGLGGGELDHGRLSCNTGTRECMNTSHNNEGLTIEI